ERGRGSILMKGWAPGARSLIEEIKDANYAECLARMSLVQVIGLEFRYQRPVADRVVVVGPAAFGRGDYWQRRRLESGRFFSLKISSIEGKGSRSRGAAGGDGSNLGDRNTGTRLCAGSVRTPNGPR